MITRYVFLFLTDLTAFVILPMVLVEGPWRARLIAAIGLANYTFNLLVPTGFHDVARGALALTWDLASLAACLFALRGATRYWMVWATSFVLLGAVTDVVFLLRPHVGGVAFSLSDDIWWYGLAAALLWGVLTEGGAASGARRGEAHA